jgi:hypothetical protein
MTAFLDLLGVFDFDIWGDPKIEPSGPHGSHFQTHSTNTILCLPSLVGPRVEYVWVFLLCYLLSQLDKETPNEHIDTDRETNSCRIKICGSEARYGNDTRCQNNGISWRMPVAPSLQASPQERSLSTRRARNCRNAVITGRHPIAFLLILLAGTIVVSRALILITRTSILLEFIGIGLFIITTNSRYHLWLHHPNHGQMLSHTPPHISHHPLISVHLWECSASISSLSVPPVHTWKGFTVTFFLDMHLDLLHCSHFKTSWHTNTIFYS